MKICRSYSSNITIVEAKILLRQAEQKKSNGRFRRSSNVWHFPWEYVSSNGGPTSFMTTSPRSTKSNILHSRSSRLFGVTKFFSIFQFAPKPERGDSIQTSFSLLKLSKLSCTRDALMLDSSNALIPKQLLARQHRPDFVQFPEQLLEAVTGALQVTVERETRATPKMTWAEWLSTVSTVLTSNCSIF